MSLLEMRIRVLVQLPSAVDQKGNNPVGLRYGTPEALGREHNCDDTGIALTPERLRKGKDRAKAGPSYCLDVSFAISVVQEMRMEGILF